MKGLISLTAAIVMSCYLGVAAQAAPATTQTKGKTKQTMAQEKAKPGPGIQNAKKALKGRIDNDKKIAETRKLAQAKKHQSRSGN